MLQETRKKRETTPLKIFPKSFITWRVYWISKNNNIKYLDFKEENEAYTMMLLFLKNEKCSWIRSNKKIILITCNHPYWNFYEASNYF